jgi:hypothetical protein
MENLVKAKDQFMVQAPHDSKNSSKELVNYRFPKYYKKLRSKNLISISSVEL